MRGRNSPTRPPPLPQAHLQLAAGHAEGQVNQLLQAQHQPVGAGASLGRCLCCGEIGVPRIGTRHQPRDAQQQLRCKQTRAQPWRQQERRVELAGGTVGCRGGSRGREGWSGRCRCHAVVIIALLAVALAPACLSSTLLLCSGGAAGGGRRDNLGAEGKPAGGLGGGPGGQQRAQRGLDLRGDARVCRAR